MINVKNVVIKKDQTGNAYEQLENFGNACVRVYFVNELKPTPQSGKKTVKLPYSDITEKRIKGWLKHQET